ncbi:nuclear transport factor 2 family protein [Roseivirga sp. E12]|uniref:nuclear transport factor 2 family protein n=1 Tax=Roseivirga sp. E12 TaxID=2819237 RepID=UPI001ABCB151|nr:nuclear transport factor 2 family protein [Roseivirga sp. E12]MBO3700015.1 nuclear transport factor 2 family protein [Roseivirga sp. E12]
MKKTQITLIAAIVLVSASLAFTFKPYEDEAAKEEVKELVLKAYVNGAFNELDVDAMRKGFHEDFAIYSPKGEAIGKYPIKAWVNGTAKRKANGYDASAEKNKWDHNFASVDVTGNAAQVKIELHNQGKHVYTDYLSLLKFDSGWRIVAKVYHEHK